MRKIARKNIAGFFVWLKVLPLQAMGFRSTLISEYYGFDLPAWFGEKYSEFITVMDGTLVASRIEFQIYNNNLFEDLQKALIEAGYFENTKDRVFHVAVLHEDAEISKVVIGEIEIHYYLMDNGMELQNVWTQ
jgi:predicted GNAT superfamily acetyltransferase